VDWECLADVVSTEFLKFAIASPAASSADLHGQPNGCEVCDGTYLLAYADAYTAAKTLRNVCICNQDMPDLCWLNILTWDATVTSWHFDL
jgi:hypothetical protein